MQLISRAQRIYDTLEKFKAQYADSRLKQKEKLAALTLAEINRENIDAIIGNDSWTRLECYECGNDCEKLAYIAPVDYDSRVQLCEKCLEKALGMVRGW